MASSNNNIQLTELDFSNIKNNFIAYLQSQDAFKDYNFQGSAMSVLLDILAYNTQYNAYYLNMVANEMFLDSALQRGSVVSHAKLLNYTPKSAIAPTAYINVAFTGVTSSSFTLPRYSNFISESVQGVNYNFVSTDATTVTTSGGTANFTNLQIKQGIPAVYTYTVNSTTNPKYVFEIPDSKIDTTSIQVTVQQNSSNTSYVTYQPAGSFLTLTPTDQVYFLQESLNGNYQINFGDGVLGTQLSDGNIVVVSYTSTDGTLASGANSFVLMDNIGGFTSSSVTGVIPASQGGDKESIDSIKFQAPKSFSSQNRAVTKEDYITAIQQNNLGFAFDSVSVWGGQENESPVFGQVFISMKPEGSYLLNDAQKQSIITNIINPISVLTVTPTIVDPDFTYINVSVNVVYNPNKTTKTALQIENGVKAAIAQFANTSLNTFNSTFNGYDLLNTVQNYDSSIVNSEYSLKLQKRVFPSLTSSSTYNLYYNTPLQKGVLLSGVSSSPALQFTNPANTQSIIDGVFYEEVPATTYGVDTISVLNPGFGYQSAPSITILGDGTGATAHAEIAGGTIQNIVVDTAGNNYTTAIATITAANGDTTGQLGAAVVNLQGRYGTLRTYYNNATNVKTILDDNAGTIDYSKGIISLISIAPVNVDNDLGQLSVDATPVSSLISSSYNTILTLDSSNPAAITVNVIAQS
jgi:hypothetical protein